MKNAQEIIDNLQFAHSVWLNELSHAEVELTIMANRLDLLEASSPVPNVPDDLVSVNLEIEQLQLAAKFIKQSVLKHIGDIYQLAKLNGQLKVISNSIHSETKDRINQFRIHLENLKNKFYKLVPIADEI